MGVFVFYIIKTHRPISMMRNYNYATRVSIGTLIVEIFRPIKRTHLLQKKKKKKTQNRKGVGGGKK